MQSQQTQSVCRDSVFVRCASASRRQNKQRQCAGLRSRQCQQCSRLNTAAMQAAAARPPMARCTSLFCNSYCCSLQLLSPHHEGDSACPLHRALAGHQPPPSGVPVHHASGGKPTGAERLGVTGSRPTRGLSSPLAHPSRPGHHDPSRPERRLEGGTGPCGPVKASLIPPSNPFYTAWHVP